MQRQAENGSLYDEMPPALLARLETADRLAPLMATASGIQGNPNLRRNQRNRAGGLKRAV